RGWSSGCRRPRSSPPLPYTTLFRSAGARGGPHRVDVTLIVHAEQRRLVERRGLRDLAGRQQARGAQQVVGELVAQRLERVLAGELEARQRRAVDEAVSARAHDRSVSSAGRAAGSAAGGHKMLTPCARRCSASAWESAVATRSTNDTVSGSPLVVITLETLTLRTAMSRSNSARAPGRLATSTSSRAAAS